MQVNIQMILFFSMLRRLKLAVFILRAERSEAVRSRSHLSGPVQVNSGSIANRTNFNLNYLNFNFRLLFLDLTFWRSLLQFLAARLKNSIFLFSWFYFWTFQFVALQPFIMKRFIILKVFQQMDIRESVLKMAASVHHPADLKIIQLSYNGTEPELSRKLPLFQNKSPCLICLWLSRTSGTWRRSGVFPNYKRNMKRVLSLVKNKPSETILKKSWDVV